MSSPTEDINSEDRQSNDASAAATFTVDALMDTLPCTTPPLVDMSVKRQLTYPFTLKRQSSCGENDENSIASEDSNSSGGSKKHPHSSWLSRKKLSFTNLLAHYNHHHTDASESASRQSKEYDDSQKKSREETTAQATCDMNPHWCSVLHVSKPTFGG